MDVRISPATPPYSETAAEDLARLTPPGGEPIGLFRTLAKNPRVLGRIRRGGLLDPGSITLRQREIVILRTTALARAEYEWGVHAAFFAAAAGLDSRCLLATVWLGPDADCWQPDEVVLVRACDELHFTGQLSDPLWSALRASFAEDQILELLVLAGLYRAISYVVNGAGIALETAALRFPPRPAEHRAPGTHAGSCLCGSIRYEIDGELGDFGYCHCRSCRKASGSAHAANAPVDRSRFRLISGETLRVYESSPGKLRSFCSRCGSPIYTHFAATPDVLRLRLGSLDTPFDKQPRAHTFVSDKAQWEPIDDELPQFSEWADQSVLDQRGTARHSAGRSLP